MAHKGGHGIKAPYETTHLRVPVAIKHKLQQQIDEYKDLVMEGIKPEHERYNQPRMGTKVSYQEAYLLAQQILKHKKSARQSLEKLLIALYEGEGVQL